MRDPVLVVLAAGASRRLGTCKALVDLGGRCALDRLLDAGLAAFSEARVVLGPDAPLVRSRLAARPGVELLDHPRWAAGRTGSLARAAATLPGRDLCVAPIDCPLVPRQVFERLLAGWREAGRPRRGWWAPRVVPVDRAAPERRYGHPVILGRELAEHVLEMPPDAPLRGLRARAEPLGSVPTEDFSVLDDLDTPADLQRLRDRVLDTATGRERGGPK